MRRTSRLFFAVAVLLAATSERTQAQLRTDVGVRQVQRPISVPLQDTDELPVLEEGLEPWPPGSNCDSCGMGPCGWTCWRPDNLWADFEYLLWWRQGRQFPPLATTSTPGTPQADAGVLGLSTTQILFGDGSRQARGARPGGRVTLGTWLDGCRSTGLMARYFVMDDADIRATFSDQQFPILARPFFDVSLNQQDARLVAFPGILTGGMSILSESNVQGGDFLWRGAFSHYNGTRIDMIAGYQYSRIDENLLVQSSSVSIDPGGSVPVGTVIDVNDLFDTQNDFHGGQIGFLTEYDRGCFTWSVLAKVGLGNMRQRVAINGSTTTTVPGVPPVTVPAGLLAQPSNIGQYSNDKFAVVPELGLRANWAIHPCVEVSAGYNLIYWSDVVQPGNQVDLAVNPTQIPGPIVGPPRPAFAFQIGDYWAHGFTFGVSARY